MYAGYILTHIGFFAANPSMWNAAIYLLGLTFQLVRIAAEEKVLAQDDQYRSFQTAVPYRLLPGVY
jgi:protein-S-isoprenylcysteine O-methyltransferase Ste14